LGWWRRNFLVPVLEAGDLAGLNELLLARCIESQNHAISGRTKPIGAAMAQERPYLLPLAVEGFEPRETLLPAGDCQGCVRVKTNWYSTPLASGVRAMVRVWLTRIEVLRDFACAATHRRCYGRSHQLLNMECDLDVLENKPGALAGSAPLR
jgi:hypothetical protein